MVDVSQFQKLSDPTEVVVGLFTVAQEPNRNREPEPSDSFFPKPKAEPEPPEPFSRNRNRPFLLNCTETKKNLFCRGTAGTENWNRPNRSTPDPWDPDILKAVRVLNLLSAVNLLHIVIHY